MATRLLVPRRGERRAAITASNLALEYPQPALKDMGWERRSSRRYPIELRAELYIGQKCIVGTTVNISSGGLLLDCVPDELKARKRVKVRLTNWPSPPKGAKVTLIVIGSVVRLGPRFVAVQRVSYEFVEG